MSQLHDTIKVADLIERLQAIPDKTLPVLTEGCDCDGDIDEVVERHDTGGVYVYLKRRNGIGY